MPNFIVIEVVIVTTYFLMRLGTKILYLKINQ